MLNANTYEMIIKILAVGVNGESTSKDLSELLQKTKIPNEPIMMFDPKIMETLLFDIK